MSDNPKRPILELLTSHWISLLYTLTDPDGLPPDASGVTTPGTMNHRGA
jgi:hypothetical protein